VSDYQSGAFASQRLWGVAGGLLAALAIVAGAFGDHGLRRQLNGEQKAGAVTSSDEATQSRPSAGKVAPTPEQRLQQFRTGTHYHLIHSIAIVLVGLLGRRGKARIVGFASAGCFIGGILLFSGGLYALAMTGVERLAMVVPFGGMLFIAGWILFAFAAGMPRTSRSGSG
jgi:uncharacterized membrane protein YgdD (TMEM256/DUF423 family)